MDEKKQYENQQLQQSTESLAATGNESANFEQAMLHIGYGRYHIMLFIASAVSVFAIGFQNGLSAYILPSAECEFKLTTAELGILNSAFVTGGTTSAMLWGIIADAIGRRNIIVWCLLIDGIFTLMSSLSQNFTIFCLFRFFSGFTIGGPSSIIASFLGEFHSAKNRAAVICALGIFWTVSWLILPVLAWIVIPQDMNFLLYGFRFNSWRFFVGIFGIPSLVSAFLLSKYPESPKFLLSTGNHKKALQIMRRMFSINKAKPPHEYPVTSLIEDGFVSCREENNSIRATFIIMWKQLCCLFSPPLLKYTILCAVITFTNMFGYYGLGLWLPELFNQFEAFYKSHPNQTITVCELMYLKENNSDLINVENVEQIRDVVTNINTQIVSIATNITAASDLSVDFAMESCNNAMDPKVFMISIIIGSCGLFGNIGSTYLSNYLDHRILPVATMVIPGICGFLIYFLQSSMQNLIVACVFSSLISTASTVLGSVMVNVFPTNVNTMAMCSSLLAGRMGAIVSNVLFGILLKVNCEVPIFLVGSLVVLGGILGILLPKSVIQMPERARKNPSPESGENFSTVENTDKLILAS